VDTKGKVVPGSERVVDPSQGKATVNQLASQAKPGETVVPVGGEYTPTASGASGGVGASTVTIYSGTQSFTVEGQAQSTDEFIESEFVHESDHAEGEDPSTKSEATTVQDQKQFEKESKRK